MARSKIDGTEAQDYNPRQHMGRVMGSVLEALKGDESPFTVFEITRACDQIHGTSASSVRIALKQLINKGRVQRIGERLSYRYQLTPDTTGQ